MAMESEYEVGCYGPESRIFGMTYGEWTAEWWKWLLSIPVSTNPLADESGQYATLHQLSNVWFLAGSFPKTGQIFPSRKARLSGERPILFPVINCEANSLEYPELTSESELVEHVTTDMNTIVKRDCLINGEKVIPHRIASEPHIFSLTIHKDNAFGVREGGTTYATSDGYWVFLKPLMRGHYQISFEGSCEFGRLNSGAVYELEIF